MKTDYFALVIATLPLQFAAAVTFTPFVQKAIATTNRIEVVNPGEQMVTVPGLEKIGPSRISTVEHCAGIYGIQDWNNLTTDSELDGMWECLLEHS